MSSIALGRETQQLPGKEPVVFEKYSCKLRLPGEGWRWAYPPDLEKGSAFIVHDGVADVMLRIRPTKRDELTDLYVQDFEGGFLKRTGGRKIGSRKITYQGQACYEFTSLAGIVDAEATARIFITEGFLYSLVVSVPPKTTPPISVSDIFDKCFEFTGTVTSKWGNVDPEYEAERAAENAFNERLLWGCLPVLVVGVGILILIRRKRNKSSQ